MFTNFRFIFLILAICLNMGSPIPVLAGLIKDEVRETMSRDLSSNPAYSPQNIESRLNEMIPDQVSQRVALSLPYRDCLKVIQILQSIEILGEVYSERVHLNRDTIDKETDVIFAEKAWLIFGDRLPLNDISRIRLIHQNIQDLSRNPTSSLELQQEAAELEFLRAKTLFCSPFRHCLPRALERQFEATDPSAEHSRWRMMGCAFGIMTAGWSSCLGIVHLVMGGIITFRRFDVPVTQDLSQDSSNDE